MTTVHIDLAGKPAETGIALAQFAQAHGLTLDMGSPARPEAPWMEPAPAPKPARVRRQPKAKPAAKAAPAASTVTLEAVEKLVAANPGARTEKITEGMSKPDKEAAKKFLKQLRDAGKIKQDGVKRSTVWTSVGEGTSVRKGTPATEEPKVAKPVKRQRRVVVDVVKGGG